MPESRTGTPFARLTGHVTLQPDLNRGLRATLAFMVPLLLAMRGSMFVDVSFAAIAAQNLAMVDLRGDYRLRFALALGMSAVLIGAAALGAAASGVLAFALAATVLMAVCGGVWRHLSSEYGPPLAISSTFIFLFALSAPAGPESVRSHVVAASLGAAWGVIVQVAVWPFRPQHALRRTVADSWVAVADLFAALAPEEPADPARRADRVLECEASLRAGLDHAYATLEAERPGPLRERLEALNLASARLATRVVALNTALDAAMSREGFATLAPVFDPALVSLSNLSRSVGVTVVSRQGGHLAMVEVRLRRVASLLRTLRTRLSASPADAQLAEIVRQIEELLPEIRATLQATIDRVEEPASSSLELLDLRHLALRPLASALNLNLQVDPALLRFTLRLAAFTAGGVAIFKSVALPHGYWLPFTIVVVLQPDYGSTRQRAAQRMLGTVAGSLAASTLLWLRLPTPLLLAAAALTMFGFGYWVKRNYAFAIFFITLFIVLLTGASEPPTLAFTVERIASTFAGGVLALLAAQLFWPVWERERFPPILGAAFRANRDYLLLLLRRLETGGGFDAEAIQAKRQVETANNAAFSSLRRLTGDPRSRREGLDHVAALANGNQRLTRVLNVLSLHLAAGEPVAPEALRPFVDAARDALDSLAEGVEQPAPSPARVESVLRALEQDLFATAPRNERERWIFAQLTRAATELSAALLTLQHQAPARAAIP